MKKQLLFSVVALAMTMYATAQTDITPTRYNFSNQPEGEFTINGFNDGWGPTHAENATTDGYVNLCGSKWSEIAWANEDGTPTQRSMDFQSGLRIHDFGGNIGKVLVYKGAGCAHPLLEEVMSAQGSVELAWPQLGFYADPAKVTTGGSGVETPPFIRISMLYKAISNDAYAAQGGCVSSFETKSATGTVLYDLVATDNLPNIDMMLDPTTYEDYTLEQGWARIEYDIQVSAAAGNPFIFTLKLNNTNTAGEGGETWLDHGAILIKELKFIQGTDGAFAKDKTASITKYIDLAKGGVGISPLNRDNKFCCTVANDVLHVSNVKAGDKIEVYNMIGVLVASEVAVSDNLSLPLDAKGFYVVSIAKKNVKVFNN
ncbi:hypothetical protein [Bacteroides sp.]